ncbi:serine/threonine-protein kinase [Mycobacterium sp.]|uniref:serine/threonine-protein kinase n=1 Tax=Mycobacterium sp. TaxID=1785 RepID=UPI002C619E2E|nr:serine/threonine-protein kinase [Mycobacterium sp.]HTQ17397.1 serine/threonine-protein kinase [Mycobacterium sp.]
MDGTPFGRYRLIELLNRGGMGEVWRAFDTVTTRVVALKVLPKQFAHDGVYQQRFQREARSAAGLNEPHVVPIYDFGEIEGRLYVTMRLIEGRDLQAILADGPLEPGRAVYIIDQAASALNAAHRIKLVHRDVKPSNILVAEEDFAYLIDFGIARATGDTSLTSTGSVVGTFAYLAPERVTAPNTADHRSDIYALTCVLYECLTGSQPFPGNSAEQQIGGHLTLPAPRPSALRAGLSAELDAVIAKGMAKNPDERFATTKEMSNAARAALNAPPAGRQPVRPTQQTRHPQGHGWSAPPTQFAPATEPTRFATAFAPPVPAAPPAAPDQRSRRRNRIAVAGGAAVVVIIAAVVSVLAFTDHKTPVGTPSTGPTSTAPPPSAGPFTGTYRADFGPSMANGKPDGGNAYTAQWALRSACPSTGCVATATASGGDLLQQAFVFDQVGDQWHAVAVTSVTTLPLGDPSFIRCTAPAEFWTVITLQPRSDGTLTGQYRASGGRHCVSERTVTFTRVGDVDLKSLPDPVGQAARAASPASAFHGRYHITSAADDNRAPSSWDMTVQTDCLRSGQRCVSYEHNDSGYAWLTFADQKWIYDFDGKSQCTDVGPEHVKVHREFPLPQPPQDPITLLTGTGHMQIMDTDCAGAFNETVKYQRTGE